MTLAEVVAAAPDAPHHTGDSVRGVSGSFKGDLSQENVSKGNSGDNEQFRRLDAGAEAANPGYNFPILSHYGGGMGCDTRQVFSGMLADNGQSVYYTPGYDFSQQSAYCAQPQGPYMSDMGSGTTGYCGPNYGTYYQQMPPGLMQYYPTEQEANRAGVKKLNAKDSAQNAKVKPGGPGKPPGYQVGPKSVLPDPANQWGLYPATANGAYYGSTIGFDCYMPQQWQSSARGFQPIPAQNIGAQGNCNPPIPGGGPGRFQNFSRVNSSSNNSGRVVKGCAPKSGSVGSNWRAKDVSKLQGKGDVTLSVAMPDSCTDPMPKPLPGKPKTFQVQEGEMILHQPPHIIEQQCSSLNRIDYNKEDFQILYEAAKFFIIKSYSEDDVHKSIKYGVWSSTPNGNKRLDEAYRKAQDKSEPHCSSCPVFFFFSVNCSGQFCGVAEMMGPVDFGKNMDFWLQGKWNGCLPVKWHIIKDVPNGHFRHIILSNNDNKPVTHSRDTQEVHFHEGLEMLKIFKFFPMRTSLLDDFAFYDDRQRVMQERKSRQQMRQQVVKHTKERASDKVSSAGDGSLESGKESNRPLKIAERTSNGVAGVPSQVKENRGCIEVGTVKLRVDIASNDVANMKLEDKADSIQVLKTKDENLQENASVKDLERVSTAIASDEMNGVKDHSIKAKAMEGLSVEKDQSKPNLSNGEAQTKTTAGKDPSIKAKTVGGGADQSKPKLTIDAGPEQSKLKATMDAEMPITAGKDPSIKVKIIEGFTEGADQSKLITAGKDPSIKAKAMEGLSVTADQSKLNLSNSEVLTSAGKEDTARLVINYKKALLEGIQGKVIVLDQSIGA